MGTEIVDFKKLEASLAPFAEAVIRIEEQDPAAPDKLKLTATVRNSGRGAICRLVGMTKCAEEPKLNDLLFIFGNIQPDESATRTAVISVASFAPTNTYRLELSFFEANDNEPRPLAFAIDGASLARPILAWTYEVVDDKSRSQTAVGNADGVIQKGEAFDLVLTVKNTGRARAAAGKVRLALPEDPSLTVYGNTEQEVGNLQPGESAVARFNIAIKQRSALSKLSGNITVSETAFGMRAQRDIELPFDVEVPVQPMAVDRPYYVSGNEAVLRSGAAETAAEYARAPKGTMLHAVGELREWVLVELPTEEKGVKKTERLWAARSALSADRPGEAMAAPVVVTRFGNLPPTITFVEPTADLTTSDDRLRVTISVVNANGKIKDVLVEMGSSTDALQKANGIDVGEGSNVGPGDQRIVRGTLDLGIGVNLVRVTARDDHDQVSTRTLEIKRTADMDTASMALLIGVEKYDSMGRISGCVADVKAVSETIQRVRRLAPDRVVAMTDDATGPYQPTRERIERRIHALADEVAPGGLAFLYFSGHGVSRNNDVFLIPQDGNEDMAISMNSVLAWLKDSRAGQKVIVIDACRAAADEKGVERIAPSLLSIHKDVAVFFSCDDGEKSYPGESGAQSIYTQCLIRALNAGLDDTAEPMTVRAVQQRIEKMMAQWRADSGKKQTPRLILDPGADISLRPNAR